MKRLAVSISCMLISNLSFGGLYDYILPYQSPLDSFTKGVQQGQIIQQRNMAIQQQQEALKQQQSQQKEFDSINVTDNSPITEDNLCDRIQVIATSVMKARQLGYQPKFLYDKLGNGEPFDSMIRLAFQRPIKNDVTEKLAESKEFGNAYYFGCRTMIQKSKKPN